MLVCGKPHAESHAMGRSLSTPLGPGNTEKMLLTVIVLTYPQLYNVCVVHGKSTVYMSLGECSFEDGHTLGRGMDFTSPLKPDF